MPKLPITPAAQQLKTHRTMRGWSQETLGKHAGLHQSTVTRAEDGNTLAARSLLAAATRSGCTAASRL